MSIREGYLHDYLAASFIGAALGLILTNTVGGAVGAWGIFVAMVVVLGIFLDLPAGFVAAYINFRLHKMGSNAPMAGLSAGLFTAIVYTVMTLMIAIVAAIAITQNAAAYFIAWIIEVVFAFIFMSLGGYLSGVFETRTFAMPGIFNLSRVKTVPPPPPMPNVQSCPTCSSPMTYVEQYNRWYCNNCKKYA